MSAPADNLLTEQALSALEDRVSELALRCASLSEENRKLQHLKEENEALHHQLHQLQQERGALLEKHELAKNRVEAMIHRLKAMEETS